MDLDREIVPPLALPHPHPHGSPQLLKRTVPFPCCPLSIASHSWVVGGGGAHEQVPFPRGRVPGIPPTASVGPAEDVVPTQPLHGLVVFFPGSLSNLPATPPGLPLVWAMPASSLSGAAAVSVSVLAAPAVCRTAQKKCLRHLHCGL